MVSQTFSYLPRSAGWRTTFRWIGTGSLFMKREFIPIVRKVGGESVKLFYSQVIYLILFRQKWQTKIL